MDRWARLVRFVVAGGLMDLLGRLIVGLAMLAEAWDLRHSPSPAVERIGAGAGWQLTFGAAGVLVLASVAARHVLWARVVSGAVIVVVYAARAIVAAGIVGWGSPQVTTRVAVIFLTAAHWGAQADFLYRLCEPDIPRLKRGSGS